MESTSYISNVSYEIENMLADGMSIDKVKEYIYKLQYIDEIFPKNLKFVDAEFDKEFSVGACAFIDTNTGETIVGFAGTNFDNEYSMGDIKADGALGIGGISKDSSYMEKTNEFIEKLKNEGHNITTTTGHSLGGALAVYVAVYHNIPSGITYNGAPLFIYSKDGHTAHLNDMHTSEIEKMLEDYKGEIIRFTSNEDWLNPGADWLNAYYIGKEYTIQNENGHDMDLFLEQLEQKYILDTILKEQFKGVELDFFEDSELTFKDDKVIFTEGELEAKAKFKSEGKVDIDMDGDGSVDVTFDYKGSISNNLWGVNGMYTGNGEAIKIDTEEFKNLSKNLDSSIADIDIEWIKSTIAACDERNEDIRGNQDGRLDELCLGIIDGLDNAQLTILLNQIEDTHGELLADANRTILRSLTEFNINSISYKFAKSDTEWFLGGTPLNFNSLRNWVSEVQRTSEILYDEITGTVEFQYGSTGIVGVTSYKVDSISDIVNAFGDVTNGFLARASEVFKGLGLRSKEDDGIVNAISKVLEVEEKNIDELKIKIKNIAKIALGIGNNFEDMDNWLAESIESKTLNGECDFRNVPIDYEVYLLEDSILDDVQDVLEAYDLQVEKASYELASYVVSDFDSLISRTKNKLEKIVNASNDFKLAITELAKRLNQNVISKSGKGQYDMYQDEVTQNHGTLDDFLGNMGTDIACAKASIIPIVEDLPIVLHTLLSYRMLIGDLKGEFSSVIEKAVYEYSQLDTIIQAQNLICVKIQTIMSEIGKVNVGIGMQFTGASIRSYQEKLEGVLTLLDYFKLMIIDSFGENSAM